MPNQRHASSMLTPDFDTYPARQLRLLMSILLVLKSDIKMAKSAFIWQLIYANILLRMTQPMQLPGSPS